MLTSTPSLNIVEAGPLLSYFDCPRTISVLTARGECNSSARVIHKHLVCLFLSLDTLGGFDDYK